MIGPIRRREHLRYDRATYALALVATLTAGGVMAAHFAHHLRRRLATAEPPPGHLAPTPGQALDTAADATQDAIASAARGYLEAPRYETVLFNMLSGFLGAFVSVRLSTTGIRAGWWPFDNVSMGGRHVHHFVPGILLAFCAGAAALLSDDPELENRLAVPFGVGVGLTFDEAALLLDLRDVYWSRDGLLSVQLSLGSAALLGATIIALRMLRRGEARFEGKEEATPPPPAAVVAQLARR